MQVPRLGRRGDLARDDKAGTASAGRGNAGPSVSPPKGGSGRDDKNTGTCTAHAFDRLRAWLKLPSKPFTSPRKGEFSALPEAPGRGAYQPRSFLSSTSKSSAISMCCILSGWASHVLPGKCREANQTTCGSAARITVSCTYWLSSGSLTIEPWVRTIQAWG